MKIYKFGVFLFLSWAIQTSTAFACKCAYPEAPGKPAPKTIEELFSYHQKIFCAVAVDMKLDRKARKRTVTFETIKKFKGDVPSKFTITDEWLSCFSNNFELGAGYLMWDNGGRCTPTKRVDKAGDDLLRILKILGEKPEDFIGPIALKEYNFAQTSNDDFLSEFNTIESFVQEVCAGRYAS